MSKKGKKTCYMCPAPDTSTEHVPPACIFPPDPKYRVNLLTVPSCDIHNGEKSDEDTHFLFILSIHFGNSAIGAQHFFNKVYPTVTQYLGTFKPMVLSHAVVPNSGGQGALEFDRERLDKHVDAMTRGLYFKTYGEKWLTQIKNQIPSLRWQEGHEFLAEELSPAMLRAQKMITTVDTNRGANPSIFYYRIARSPDKTRFAAELTFYSDFRIYIMGH